MSKHEDLTGQRFGRWTAMHLVSSNPTRWLCRCDCGVERSVRAGHLKNGASKSCGCLLSDFSRGKALDLTGQRYGRLTALKRVANDDEGFVRWECICDCGKSVIVRTSYLRSGGTKSCGCMHRDEASLGKKAEIALREYVEENYEDDTHKAYIANTDKAPKHSRTGIRGVGITKDGKYFASIQFRKKEYYLGKFANLNDAVQMRKAAEELLYVPYVEDDEINEYASSADLRDACRRHIDSGVERDNNRPRSTSFGERMRAERLKTGISQKELAEKLGTSQSQLSRYEHDIKVPSISMASEIAKALNVGVDKLVK